MSFEPNPPITAAAAAAEDNDDEKTAKLVRERSTAQKRRKIKRDELSILNSAIQDLEGRRATILREIQTLPNATLNHILGYQQQERLFGCRLCSILDAKTVEYSSVDHLLHHLRAHHTGEIRTKTKRMGFDLERFAIEVPLHMMTEQGKEAEAEDSNSEDGEDEEEEKEDNEAELKRKMRLKRNAASARKSRKRKRLQLERWRMHLPQLRSQVEALEASRMLAQQYLGAGSGEAAPSQLATIEPDVLSAAQALLFALKS